MFLLPLPDLPERRGSRQEWNSLWSPQLLAALHLHLHPEERGQGEVQHRGRVRQFTIIRELYYILHLHCQGSDLGDAAVALCCQPCVSCQVAVEIKENQP